MAELEFKKGLYKIASHFSGSEVGKLKFILSDLIPRRRLEWATNAFHIFCLLESNNKISRSDLSFFKEVLGEVHKAHYIDRYLSESRPSELNLTPSRPLQDARLTSFLAALADDLTRENVRDIGLFFSGETLRMDVVENLADGVKLFEMLKDAGVSVEAVRDVMNVLSRKDLVNKIDNFINGSSQMALERQTVTSPDVDAGHKLSKGHQEEGMDAETCSSGFTSLVATSMVTTPTHLPGFSMASTPSSDISMDTGGRAGRIVLPRGKEVSTQQLSFAVEESTRKVTQLKKVVSDIEQEKSHTSDTSRVRELEALLWEKVQEVQSQMEETRKLRDALATQKDAPTYPMKRKPHGLAVIIVNGKFDENVHSPQTILKDRAGAQRDEQLFKSTFEFLGYTSRVHRNLKSVEMHEVMKRVSELDHTHYDSLVVCVSTHGNQRAIYGSDSVEVKRAEFYNSVKSCDSLKDKPKLFFIQACRLPIVSADSPQGQNGEAPPIATPLHPDADMLIANASTPDNAAYISPELGSWFVQALQKNLTNPALIYGRTLAELLEEVNAMVCQQCGIMKDTEENVRQCVEVSTSLRMGVRFFQNQ